MGHKISVCLLGSHCPFKAQCEGMYVLHFSTMSLINNCEPKLGHFIETHLHVLQRTKPLL